MGRGGNAIRLQLPLDDKDFDQDSLASDLLDREFESDISGSEDDSDLNHLPPSSTYGPFAQAHTGDTLDTSRLVKGIREERATMSEHQEPPELAGSDDVTKAVGSDDQRGDYLLCAYVFRLNFPSHSDDSVLYERGQPELVRRQGSG